jgi:hypothetical protein
MVHLLNTVLMCDGVMNIILKKSTNGGSENARSNSEGDEKMIE